MNFRRNSKQNDTTQTITTYGHALVAALRAFRVLEPKAGWFERLQIRLLRATYQQRLRALVAELPAEVSNEFFRKEDSSS